MFGFLQGTTTDNPFWNKVRDFLSEPTQEEIDCQAPKPILLNTGPLLTNLFSVRYRLVSNFDFKYLFSYDGMVQVILASHTIGILAQFPFRFCD